MHYAGKKTTLSLIKIKINLNQFNSFMTKAVII